MKPMKFFLPLLAVILMFDLAACGEEQPVPVISLGDVHTAATSRELYTLFAADEDNGYADLVAGEDTRPTTPGSSLQNGGIIQVEGYDENDMVKTDGAYLYILDAGDMKIVSAAGEQTELLSVTGVWDEQSDDRYETARGLYVSGDTVAVLVDAEVFGNDDTVATYTDQCHVRLYDVSDPREPKLYADFAQDGYLLDSRLHEGIIYLVSIDYKIDPRQDEGASYLPNIWDDGSGSTLPLDHVFICPADSARAYTLLSAIHMDDARRVDACAFTGESSSVCMDRSGLYLARTKRTVEDGPRYPQDEYTVYETIEGSATELKRVELRGDTFTLTAITEVDGRLLNQYAMDLYDGALRVATTSDRLRVKRYEDEDGHMNYSAENTRDALSSNVFTFDKALGSLGAVTGIASGMDIYSARLIEDMACFITYDLDNPLLVIDLSDPGEPRALDWVNVDGVTNYLHLYESGKLFGLGLSDRFMLQAEIYDVSDPEQMGLETSLELDFGSSEATRDPNVVLLAPEQELLGFPADDSYVLLRYDDGELTQLGAVDFIYHTANTRGIAVEDCFYVCDPQAIAVVDLRTMETLKTITFGAG